MTMFKQLQTMLAVSSPPHQTIFSPLEHTTASLQLDNMSEF